MAKLNLDFNKNSTGYSDGESETEILEALNRGVTLKEIMEDTVDPWSSFYHLSPDRENILNWFDFKKGSQILEVGSGCGALTRLLASKGEVTSIELTYPRANINYERNKDLENLEIIVGNFNDIKFNKKFDYIILNGVLEYAGSFIDSETPYQSFLKRLKELLKPDGKLLIAIENRIGLKYFNGVPEDHTSMLFDGINGYKNIDSVKTFTKTELINLLALSGFKYYKFFYPFPDYKFPQQVFTDESIDLLNGPIPTHTANVSRFLLFDETEVFYTLKNDGIADHFFNSFLVEASLEPIENKVNYAKIAPNRNERFKIITSIIEENGNKKVLKRPFSEKSKEHIEKILAYRKNNPTANGFSNVKAQAYEDGILFEFIIGESLAKKLLKDLEEGKKQAFIRTIKDFAARLYQDSEVSEEIYSDEFKEVFGDDFIPGGLHLKRDQNIDLIFDNILIDENNKYNVIDYEWVFDFDIPVEFILFRALYFFYYTHLIVRKNFTFEELLKMADINPENIERFKNWDIYFGDVYVNGEGAKAFYKPEDNIYEELKARNFTQNMFSSLYVDIGLGFIEEYRLLSKMKVENGHFKVSFNLKPISENDYFINNLRWDPAEGPCAVKDVKITTNTDEELHLVAPEDNFLVNTDGWYYNLGNDPSFLIQGNYEGLTKLEITGKIFYPTIKEIPNVIFALKDSIEKKNKLISKLKDDLIFKEERIRELTLQINLLIKEINTIRHTLGHRFIQRIKKIVRL